AGPHADELTALADARKVVRQDDVDVMRHDSLLLPLRRDRERQERDLARALDRERDLALVRGAVAADAARNDLAALADEVLERLRILVIDDERLVGAVAAHALPAHPAPSGRVRVEVRRSSEVAIVVVAAAASAAAVSTA